jgi:hypothetical protein
MWLDGRLMVDVAAVVMRTVDPKLKTAFSCLF